MKNIKIKNAIIDHKLIIDRINFILNKINQKFDAGIFPWWFPNAKEGQMGEIEIKNNLIIFNSLCTKEILCHYNNKTIDLGKEIPVE